LRRWEQLMERTQFPAVHQHTAAESVKIAGLLLQHRAVRDAVASEGLVDGGAFTCRRWKNVTLIALPARTAWWDERARQCTKLFAMWRRAAQVDGDGRPALHEPSLLLQYASSRAAGAVLVPWS